MIKIDEIVQRIEEFPTLPTIYSTLLDVMANPRSTAKDVADIIAQDQSSAVKVLKVANSSLYGFYGRINTITQAIVYIGFDEVKNLVIALSIMDMFKISKSNNFMNPVIFWKNSIAVGVITRLIGKTIGVKNLENYFLAGILHDIGKLLFLKFIPEEYGEVFAKAIKRSKMLREIEQEELGITSAVAGELLAEKWRLPLNIRNSIRYKSVGIVDNKIDTTTACVHLANITADFLGLGLSDELVIQRPNAQIWTHLNLPDNFFIDFRERIIQDYEESTDLLLRY